MNPRSVVLHAAEFVWDILFPAQCVACGVAGEWWCAACREAIEVPSHNRYPQAPSNLVALLATGFYHEPKLRRAIQAFKYSGATQLLPSIKKYVTRWHAAQIDPLPWAHEQALFVQPVPTSPERVRARGYDQASLIADIVIENSLPGAHKLDALRRHPQAMAQASLVSHELRQANVHNTFDLVPGVQLPHSILLVDDVVTSGSSLREAARVLTAGGAQTIYGFALALGA